MVIETVLELCWWSTLRRELQLSTFASKEGSQILLHNPETAVLENYMVYYFAKKILKRV